VIWVGGGLTPSLIGLRVRRNPDLAVLREFAQTLSFLGLRVFTPAVVVLLLSGVWLVLSHSGDFTQDRPGLDRIRQRILDWRPLPKPNCDRTRPGGRLAHGLTR
jgi:hypothetical protein